MCRVGLPGCRVTAGSLPGADCRVVPGAAGCCQVGRTCVHFRVLPGAAGLPGCRVARLPGLELLGAGGSCWGCVPGVTGLGGGYQVGDSFKQRQVSGVLSRECRVRQAYPVPVGSNPGFERTFARVFSQIL